jgi:hypothetical protein
LAIARFVDQIVSVTKTDDRPFEEAARHLYFLAESAEVALGDAIRSMWRPRGRARTRIA